MKESLIVLRANKYGMRRDAQILAEAIEGRGGRVDIVHKRQRGILHWLLRRRAAENLFFIERIFPMWYSAGRRCWLVPNQERFPRRHLHRLAKIDGVLAKTKHAQEIFSAAGARTRLLGFTSEDCHDPAVEKDWNSFLHIAGGSTLKGTEELLALWQRHPEWPELVLVQKRENAPQRVPANVRVLSGFLGQDELRVLQNRCGIHLCPSRSEGWGHYIVEAMSAGSVVVTTDGPPMNEHVTAECGVLVAAGRSEPRHLGTNYFVDPAKLEEAIEGLLRASDADKAKLGRAARARFQSIDENFRTRAGLLLEAGA